MDIKFFINAFLLGLALAADAFAVSIANGMNHSKLKVKDYFLTGGMFGLFQFAMPMLGWLIVRYLESISETITLSIPYAALFLLSILGTKMICNAILGKETEAFKTGFVALIIQSLATSIDALSTGFVNVNYLWYEALISSLIIGVVTFILCVIGGFIGKVVGNKFTKASAIIGGIILIGVGLEIYFTSLLGI